MRSDRSKIPLRPRRCPKFDKPGHDLIRTTAVNAKFGADFGDQLRDVVESFCLDLEAKNRHDLVDRGHQRLWLLAQVEQTVGLGYGIEDRGECLGSGEILIHRSNEAGQDDRVWLDSRRSWRPDQETPETVVGHRRGRRPVPRSSPMAIGSGP